MNIPAYESGRGARHAHASLQQCVAAMDCAQHSAVLWFGEILRRRLYVDLGYSSIYQYAAEELGFSTTRTGDFKRLAEKLDALPKVKAKISSGELGYTKAREIVKVASPETEHDWLEVADQQSRRELEITVKRARSKVSDTQVELLPTRPTPPPATVTIGFEMSPSQYARYEALMNRMGNHSDKAEQLLEMMAAYLDRDDVPRGANQPGAQIHVHECPTCAAATVATPRGDLHLADDEAEATQCDAMIHEPGHRNKSTIPPRVRRAVLARDRHRCRRKGCHHTRFLDIHHLIPRARGGTNETANLVTLCSACHRLAHRRGMDLTTLLDVVESPPTTERKADRSCSRPPATI